MKHNDFLSHMLYDKNNVVWIKYLAFQTSLKVSHMICFCLDLYVSEVQAKTPASATAKFLNYDQQINCLSYDQQINCYSKIVLFMTEIFN